MLKNFPVRRKKEYITYISNVKWGCAEELPSTRVEMRRDEGVTRSDEERRGEKRRTHFCIVLCGVVCVVCAWCGVCVVLRVH